MSRRNVDHTEKDVLLLAGTLEDFANQLRELAARYNEFDIDEPMNISHRFGVDTGLVALPKLLRDLRQKQDDFIVERSRRTSQGAFAMPSLSAAKPARKRK